MNWDDGRLFLAIARSGQMLAAAKTLGINQATLSRRMTGFERSLGVNLLIRRTNGCQLTDEGQRLLKKLEHIEAQYLSAQSILKPDHYGCSGTLRFGAPDGFGIACLAPHLHQLQENNPKLKIQLVPVPRTFSLSQREADIAVVVGRPNTGRLITQKLTDYTLSLYASHDYCTKRGTPQTKADLTMHDFVSYVEDLIYAPALAYADDIGTQWQSTIEIASATGQMEAVRAGAGIGILHDYIASADHGLKLIVPDIKIKRSYWLVYHEDLRGLARIDAGMQFVHKIVKEGSMQFSRMNDDKVQ